MLVCWACAIPVVLQIHARDGAHDHPTEAPPSRLVRTTSLSLARPAQVRGLGTPSASPPVSSSGPNVMSRSHSLPSSPPPPPPQTPGQITPRAPIFVRSELALEWSPDWTSLRRTSRSAFGAALRALSSDAPWCAGWSATLPRTCSHRVCRTGTGTLLAPPLHIVREVRHKYTWWLLRTSSSRMRTDPLRSMMTHSYACTIAPHRTCSARCRCSAAHLSFCDSGSHDLPPLRNGAFRFRRY